VRSPSEKGPDRPGQSPPVIYTIGHSNHSLEHFIELLRAWEIAVLADVRSAPYSRHVPHFNKTILEKTVESGGMIYLYLGRELGGLSKGGHKQRRGHKPGIGPDFDQGIKTIGEMAETRRLALMCAEENPLRCHRFHLITPALTAAGLAVSHIRGDGRVEGDEALRAEISSRPQKGDQMELF